MKKFKTIFKNKNLDEQIKYFLSLKILGKLFSKLSHRFKKENIRNLFPYIIFQRKKKSRTDAIGLVAILHWWQNVATRGTAKKPMNKAARIE